MEASGLGTLQARCIAPYTGDVILARNGSRSVLGSMNDMMRLCKSDLSADNTSAWDATEFLNKTPFGGVQYRYPVDAFASLPTE